ncbi:MAG: polyprenyl glycosylphosphotransferase [Rhizobiales bacterium]|nr:polyprenyl glycosylphosphotransferase [Hyphomicrobiales bacterium]
MSSILQGGALTANLSSYARSHIVLRTRFQLFGGIVFAVFLPYLLILPYAEYFWNDQSKVNTMAASCGAIGLGFFLHRRMTNFPGVQATFYIAPIFVGCFALFAFLFLISRVEYSRFQFFSALSASVVWFYAIHVMTRRLRQLKLAVVPDGAASRLLSLDGVVWSVLRRAEFPAWPIDALVVDLRSDLDESWSRFITDAALAGIPVFHAKNVKESLTGRVEIDHLSENVFGSLVPGLLYLKLKFALEWCVAAVAAVFLLPIMALIAVLIRLESPGPVMFAQRRMGYQGRPFTMYKFRTMLVCDKGSTCAEDEKTEENDPRITRCGKWLRRHRLDEILQVFNILRGEMSWIGPRPEAIHLSKSYESELPYYRYRHIVRPGISGWAQVNQGHVADVTDVHEKLYYDFYYIKHCSLWLDILIALRTVRTMIQGTGAK